MQASASQFALARSLLSMLGAHADILATMPHRPILLAVTTLTTQHHTIMRMCMECERPNVSMHAWTFTQRNTTWESPSPSVPHCERLQTSSCKALHGMICIPWAGGGLPASAHPHGLCMDPAWTLFKPNPAIPWASCHHAPLDAALLAISPCGMMPPVHGALQPCLLQPTGMAPPPPRPLTAMRCSPPSNCMRGAMHMDMSSWNSSLHA